MQLAEHLASRSKAAASWARASFVLDTAMLLAAIAATELGATAAGVEHVPVVWLVVFPLLVLAGVYGRAMYDWPIPLQALDDVRARLVTTAGAAMGGPSPRGILRGGGGGPFAPDPPPMAVLSLRVILGGGGDDLSAQTLRLWAFAAFYIAAGRVAIHWSQVRARTHGDTAKPTLVVGAGRVGRLTARRLMEHPEFGLRPVGFLDKEPRRDPAAILPVLGASWDLEQVISDHAIEHVVVTFSTAPNEVLLREMRRCEELGVSVSLVPRLFERVTGKLSVEHIGGLPLL